MNVVMALGILVSALGFLSATVRFIGTRRSATVTGVSFGFAWLGLSANALWLAYGLRMSVPPQVAVSVVWGLVFGYILWRLNNRRFTIRLGAGMVGVVAAGAALAYGLSGDAAGWLGGLLVLGSTAPQAVKIWRTRDINGVAPMAWLVSLGMGLLWCVYGALAGLAPVLILNAAYMVLVVLILAGVVRAKAATTSEDAVAGPVSLLAEP